MTKRFCKVKHNPPESYGDCIKACIDTILDRDDSPHSFNNRTGEECWKELRDWMKPLGFVPFVSTLPDDFTLDEVYQYMGMNNPDTTYMLMGGTGSGDHAIVCKGNKQYHNPAWSPLPLTQPHSNGYWLIVVMGKI